jgi:hypothetical protein
MPREVEGDKGASHQEDGKQKAGFAHLGTLADVDARRAAGLPPITVRDVREGKHMDKIRKAEMVLRPELTEEQHGVLNRCYKTLETVTEFDMLTSLYSLTFPLEKQNIERSGHPMTLPTLEEHLAILNAYHAWATGDRSTPPPSLDDILPEFAQKLEEIERVAR